MTPKHDLQHTILHFIAEHQREHGCAPTLREMMKGLGLSSTSVAEYHLRRLEQAGYLERDFGIARGVRLLPAADSLLPPQLRTIRLTLPYPPSANRYWHIARGRMIVSNEARIYKEHAAVIARSAMAHEPLIDEKVSVRLIFHRPRKAGDLDNLIKVTLDSLNRVVWNDDEQVVHIAAERADDKVNPRVEVEIQVVSDADAD